MKIQIPGTGCPKCKKLTQNAEASKCQPCFACHFKPAHQLGISQAEIDEPA